MKFKPIYIYIIVFIAAVIALFIFTDSGSKETVNIQNKEMPEDEIHQGMKNPDKSPGKENVREDFYLRMENLKKEVDSDPSDTVKVKEYADLLAAAHKQEDAIIYYNKILEMDPARTDVLLALSIIYYNKKEFDKSEEITNKIVQYDKDNVQAIYNLGAIAAAKGNLKKAQDIWENLISQYPNSKTANLAESSLEKLRGTIN